MGALSEPVLPVSRKLTALIVEDDVTSLIALRMLLEHYGFEVSVALTVAEAMKKIDKSPPQHVFLDLKFPDGDGLEILERIKKVHQRVKVAVITGTTDRELLHRVERMKPDIILAKPLDFMTLLERIKPAA